MTAGSLTSDGIQTRRGPLVLAASIFAIELALIGIIFKHVIDFECRANWPGWACGGASGVLVAVYALLAALTLYFVLRPAPLVQLLQDAGHSMRPLVVNFIGFAIALIPTLLLRDGVGTSTLSITLALWAVGFIALTTGTLLFIAPLLRWRDVIRSDGLPLSAVCLAGLAAPFLATIIRPLWQLETIANATFRAVVWAIDLFGYEVEIYPEHKIIGAGDFYIDIAPVCSGIEGIALVTIFVTLYLSLFRKELRFPRAFWLYPAGIAVSAFLNIVRITVLLMIGLDGKPELAVGGFHSHAGWLMFTLIALGVVLAARTVPALSALPAGPQQAAAAPVLPVHQDINAARILPFAIFMLSALFVQALSQNPGLVYPLRVLAMAAGLVVFWKIYMGLAHRPTGTSLGVGAAIGLMWVLVPYNPADTSPAHGGLTGALLVGWLILRGLGTIVLVPIIEELFFRDYLEGKLRGFSGPILAALITAGLFAALHDRWIEAFAAGLLFSWLMQRRGRVIDAIAAHAVANALIFAVALITAQMHII